MRELQCSTCGRTFHVPVRPGRPPTRCGTCLDARRTGYGVVLLERDGHLPVTCWCEAHIVYVSKADIKAGRTRPCRLARCQRMAA